MSGFKYSATTHLVLEDSAYYVKQLNSRLARSKKASLQEGFLLFPDLGAGFAASTDNGVQLTAYADEEENLTMIQSILAKQLYKLAKVEDKDAWWS